MRRSRKQIESIAEIQLRDFRPEYLKEPQPVDIEGFIREYLHLSVDVQDIAASTGCLGMFVLSDTDSIRVRDKETGEVKKIPEKAGTVVIDRSLLWAGQERRYRFALAHEAAHGALHSLLEDPYDQYLSLFYGSKERVYCCNLLERDYVKIPAEDWSDENWREWQADAFASAILMPVPMVRKLAGNFNPFRARNMNRERLIQDVADTFGVSSMAAEVRLRTLGIIRAELAEKERLQDDTQKELPPSLRRNRDMTDEERAEEEEIFNRRDAELWGYKLKRWKRKGLRR